jgi:hypothetical protein
MYPAALILLLSEACVFKQANYVKTTSRFTTM